MIKVIDESGYDYYNPKNPADAIRNIANFLSGMVYAKGTDLEFELEPRKIKDGIVVEMPDGFTHLYKIKGDGIEFSVKGSGEAPEYFEPEYWSEIVGNVLEYIQDSAPGFNNKSNKNLWSK